MNDDDSDKSPKATLKSEWTFLLESFVEDLELTPYKTVNGLPHEFITETMRSLSEQRHTLFQQIENIKEQIEENYTVIENLELVGSDTQEVLSRIASLHEQGASLTDALGQLDRQIKKTRTLAG